MKLVILLASLFLFLSCNSNKEKAQQPASTTATGESANIAYPLPTLYSATWEAGDPKHAAMVLNIAKDWMDSNFESLNKNFADSIYIYLASGDRMIGARDSIMTTMKNFRKMYSEVKAEIHSIVPLRHRDTKEDWVCVWLKEITTTSEGKKDSVEIQESWRLNNQGKAELVYQYAATIKLPTK